MISSMSSSVMGGTPSGPGVAALVPSSEVMTLDSRGGIWGCSTGGAEAGPRVREGRPNQGAMQKEKDGSLAQMRSAPEHDGWNIFGSACEAKEFGRLFDAMNHETSGSAAVEDRVRAGSEAVPCRRG